ncbi:Ankyrin-1 [Dactylella cylindrospora]|nr:Ankyrin-1 [Dactylella cylindrospora]
MQVARSSKLKKLRHDEYTVGWICALPVELAVAKAMLDEEHCTLEKSANDSNAYSLGSIGSDSDTRHNVVIVCLPAGKYGTIPAATVAVHLVNSFPSIKVAVMVGIGGGVPSPENNYNVRLGDVVVSTPIGEYPGVVQWDMGKEEGSFKRTGALNNPPNSLLTALSTLQAEYEMRDSWIPEHLKAMVDMYPRLKAYIKSDDLEDFLFKQSYQHITDPPLNVRKRKASVLDEEPGGEQIGSAALPGQVDCPWCDKDETVSRKPNSRETMVHFGLVASGNSVIKNAAFRDKLNRTLGGQVLCIEMEAAGLMNNLPCIVIRGICDYADSHKNERWQKYAAAVAAAFTKEFLGYVQLGDITQERAMKEVLEKLDRVEELVSRTDTNVQSIKTQNDRKEDRKILEWLSPMDFSRQQTDNLSRRHEGTGNWFFESEQYNTWAAGESQTLYCRGLPGTGKTTLTAAVIDDLLRKYENDEQAAIAYVIFKFEQRSLQSADATMASILKQLSRGCICDQLRALYEYHEKRGTRPLLKEISGIIMSIAKAHSRVFIIVDALDECQTASGNQQTFLSEVSKLRDETRANIFVTSRHISEISTWFEQKVPGHMALGIHATDEDIRSLLYRRALKLEGIIQYDAGLREEVIENIIKEVDGMVLLAELRFDSFHEKYTIYDVRQMLESQLSVEKNAYDMVYEIAMDRIRESTADDTYKLIMAILAWIVCAKRLLTVAELGHALSIEIDNRKYEHTKVFHDKSIRSLVSKCCGLVTIDESSGSIRLVHFTAQEYFNNKKPVLFPNSESDIAKKCITYLLYDAFKEGPCFQATMVETRLRTYSLYRYAAHHWSHHTQDAEDARCLQFSLELLQDTTYVQACMEGLLPIGDLIRCSFKSVKGATGLHLAALLGFEKGVVQLILALSGERIDPNAQTGDHETPLFLAAQGGHGQIVKFLLNFGADPNIRNGYKSPLRYAIVSGQATIAKILLQKGAEMNFFDYWSKKLPLAFALDNSDAEMVQLLIDHGADPNKCKSKFGKDMTALEYGIHERRFSKECLHAITKSGVKMRISKKAIGEALVWGATDEVPNLVVFTATFAIEEYLRDCPEVTKRRCLSLYSAIGIDKNREAVISAVKDVRAGSEIFRLGDFTPLFYAVHLRLADIVQVLIDHGADLEARRKGETALLVAARLGYEDMIELLADSKAEIEVENNDRQTPLMAAIRGGHTKAVEVLLCKMTNTNAANSFIEDALFDAVLRDREEITPILLNTGVNLEARDKAGNTVLMIAAMHGRMAITKVLLDKGANPNARRKGDRSSPFPLNYAVDPLLLAAYYGYVGQVELLLDNKANIKGPENSPSTPLLAAAANGQAEVVEVLLRRGASLESQHSYSHAPLYVAADRSRWKVMEVLLNWGVDTHVQDADGRELMASMNVGIDDEIVMVMKRGKSPERHEVFMGVVELLKGRGFDTSKINERDIPDFHLFW